MKRHILAKAIPVVVGNGSAIKNGAVIEFCERFLTQHGKTYPAGSRGTKIGGNRYTHLVEMHADTVRLHVPRSGFSFVVR